MNINLSQLKLNLPHFPVLIREVLNLLIKPNNETQIPKVIVDCTFGAGGYSSLILQHTNHKVIAIDRDNNVSNFATSLQQQYPNRFTFYNEPFSDIKNVLTQEDVDKVDAIIADLGMSTMQISDSTRGFSFKHDGPLLMQMGKNTISALNFVNNAKENILASVLLEYGEEIKAHKITKAIVQARVKHKITTTLQLKQIINQVVKPTGKTDSATKSFQAIRIYVNDELNEIIKLLNNAVKLLNVDGKIIVISFHSLEDRIVKNFFNEITNKLIKNYNNNDTINNNQQNFTVFKPESGNLIGTFELINKKVVTPQFDEVRVNRLSRGAKLRAVIRQN